MNILVTDRGCRRRYNAREKGTAQVTRRFSMKTYLRVINPIVAMLVLFLCVWAAMNDEGFKPLGMFRGGIPTYFLAKGLFCSSALILIGKIVELLSEKK